MRIFDDRGFFDSSFVFVMTVLAMVIVAFGLGMSIGPSASGDWLRPIVNLGLVAVPVLWFGVLLGKLSPRRASHASELRPAPQPRQEHNHRIDVQA